MTYNVFSGALNPTHFTSPILYNNNNNCFVNVANSEWPKIATK